MSFQTRLKSACVIGAGVAGLCALRHLSSRLDRFGPIVCYEQTTQVGGTWIYTDKVGLEDNGLPVHTSMYRDLRTNAPSQIMEFPDFKSHYSGTYPPQEEVLQFIHDYAAHFKLLPYIQFEHHLKQIARDNANDCWKLTVVDMKKQKTFTRSFDVLILAPGRNFIPMIPEFKSINKFKGSIIHSHDYRFRQPYSGQKVAVIGAGPSGMDIGLQISTVATEVYFINRTDWQFDNLPENVKQIKGSVEEFTANSMKIKMISDGKVTEFQVNSVIYATGYRIYLNYLNQEECGLRLNDDDTLDGIYRHFINIRYPSMALFSIIRPYLNLPLYQLQMLYYIKLVLGEIAMPSTEQMLEEVNADIVMRREKGMRDSDRHLMKIPLMREYFKLLEKDANLKPSSPVLFDLMEEVAQVRKHNPISYKDINYRIVGDSFEIV